MKYEYRTASFILPGRKHGEPLEEVDQKIAAMLEGGWEYVELSSSSSTAALSVVVVFRRSQG